MKTAFRFAVVMAFLGMAAPFVGAQPQQIASVEQLKNEAFKALRGGQFDRTGELLSEAASLSQDASLVRMNESIHQFQSQRQQFVTDRTKGYEKALADIKALHAAGFDEAALDRVKDAGLLALNKDAFQKEPWVISEVAKAAEMGKTFESKEQWIKAQRVYSNLGSIDMGNPLWKERFRASTTRLRLLGMYTPDEFKRLIEDEVKQREVAEQLVNPSTQPTTKPAVVAEDDSFKTDWRDVLRGVKLDMLMDALDDARGSYWRDVTYKTLTLGGLRGLQNLATTRGLEKEFKALSDEKKRGDFLGAINDSITLISKAASVQDGRIMRRIIQALMDINSKTLDLPEEVIANEFADGAFAELDPFSSMIWPGDWDLFNKSVQGEFDGVGIEIRSDEDGNLQVVSPLEDSPAWRARIQAGDLITRINGKNAKGISVNQAVKNITGPGGTKVLLTIKSPNGTVKDLDIKRETIHVASVKGYTHMPGGGWDYFIDPVEKIAYTRLTNFTKSTDEELTKAIADMRKHDVKAVILDLRNNPGGLLSAATDVCDKFLSSGTIVSTKGERDLPMQPPILAKQDADDLKIPVVVLVNQFSASASEIVSGALQDQHRALIVGERSFGKGSVQMLFPLAGKSAALKLTTSHYYLPSGRCLHKEDNSTTWGVDPDLTVEMTGEQMRAANEARIGKEVLRFDDEAAMKLQAVKTNAPSTAPSKTDLLATDPQLSAAVLLLKLQLAGATM